ncbi:hypothetical protein VTN31DRAFT_1944 [Thermomyces dupontii]|uniref:uncharacterized protein n=1 Tax=Talaromyces thermophilus TaxID=28565 RepID=UPI00374205B5
MHKPSISQLIYNATFPHPRSSDPVSFSAHVSRNLVAEVRQETMSFYGTLNCIEAQYPGLDYTYGPHRLRLSRWPWHRKLFRVFDELGLTDAEIHSLCRWEGTRSAKERYEKEEGIIVRDTTADNVRPATPRPLPSIEFSPAHELYVKPPQSKEPESGEEYRKTGVDTLSAHLDADESSDEEMESYGVQLNQRLLYATAARERGANVPLDEVWEQWLKEAAERGNYSDMLQAVRSGQPLDVSTMHSSSSNIYPAPPSHTSLRVPSVRSSAPRSEPVPRRLSSGSGVAR